MPLSIIKTRAALGLSAPLVTVETHISGGLPSLSIVGLPETAVKESRDRVRSAIINSQFEFPLGRITIHLGPAELAKEGGRYDLAIALSILAASNQVPPDRLNQLEVYGELALSGKVQPVKALLPSCIECFQNNHTAVVPHQNLAEACLPENCKCIAVKDLAQICAHLNNMHVLETQSHCPIIASSYSQAEVQDQPDLSDIKGQPQAKRALEVAAAGGHNLLMSGPPGTGKTMLASRLGSILPDVSHEEALEIAKVQSLSNTSLAQNWKQRPFRSPHHTASSAALVGGGSNPRPGEITLASLGILFLDELPEFDRKVLEVLREPLESGEITISRAKHQVTYPANFQLVAAMNPTPCGKQCQPEDTCYCTPQKIEKYRSKISGPLLDRIDLQIEVNAISKDVLLHQNHSQEETSHQVKTRVSQARQIQLDRAGKTNHLLNSKEIARYCKIQSQDAQLLSQAIDRLGLSARAYHRILKVARTIADLEQSHEIATHHLTEALSYRKLDFSKR